MKKTGTLSKARSWISFSFCILLIFTLLATPLQQLKTRAQKSKLEDRAGVAKRIPFDDKVAVDEGTNLSEADIVPGYDFTGFSYQKGQVIDERTTAVGTDQGFESEPNNTFGTADVLTGTDGKIQGSLLPTTAVPATNDQDWYSFTTTSPNSKIYAATMTSGSGQGTAGGSGDTVLEVIASNGTTVLELDDEDGTIGSSSSSIAGTTLATPGTYYLHVTNFSTTVPIAPYDLYFAVRSGATTPETEPNNNGTPQALPASQYVNGVIDPATPADTDTFSFNANAGDKVFLSLDLDPERDTTTFNGRIGLGLFGTPTNVLVSGDGGTFDTIDSEAIFFTVKTTGTYIVYVDSQVAGGGGPTATYAFTIGTIPALPAGSCTTYTNNTPTPIGDLALTSSTINIPDSKVIRTLRVITDITHPNFPDLDVHLRSPANNDNGLFTDVGNPAQTGAQNIRLEEDAAIPLLFTVLNGVNWRPEPSYNLNWFRGENTLGTWTLDIRDDTTANTGTVNSWSLEACEEPAPTGSVVYSEDFEATNGGYTSSGTANEWEYGAPATAAQTTTSPFIAAFNTCGSGTKCWKTDLDNTYDISSNQDLTSPPINLTSVPGTASLSWKQRYQMETISFDRIWVRVTNTANTADTRIVWNSTNATMSESNGSGASLGNLPESAGWGIYSADISDFAGKNIQVSFHMETDNSVNLGGWAIDDVTVRNLTPAVPVVISGQVTTSSGRYISGAVVTLTEQNGTPHYAITNSFGYYKFFNILTQQTVTVSPAAKRYTFTPAVFPLNGNTTTNFQASP